MIKGEVIEKRYERTPLETVVPLTTPYVIYIDPCGVCNFKCNFCPCNISDYNKIERHKIMKLDFFKKIVDDIALFPEKVKVIYLYGFGEPLLNKDFFKMARYLKNKDVCREIRVVTNGSILCPEVNKELIDSGVDLVRISIEALGAEQYKKICDYDIDYELFVDNIRDLYEHSRGTQLKVAAKIINVTLKSEEDVKKFFDIYEGITDYHFIEDIVAGWPDFQEIKFPNEKVIESNNWIWKRDNYKRCSYPLTTMLIHSNGVVGPCPCDWKMSIKLGDVNNESIADIWNSDKWRNLQLFHLKKDRKLILGCKNCEGGAIDNIDDVVEAIAKGIERKLDEGKKK